MAKKSTKASRKYVASGRLKKEIQSRKKHQQVKKKIESRKAAKTGSKKGDSRESKVITNETNEDATEDEIEEESSDDGVERTGKKKSKFAGMSVDDFLGGGFLEGDKSEEDTDAEGEEEGSDENEADDASFASVDDLEDEGEMHKVELAKLAEKDPEFFKYLQDNDNELLDFDASTADNMEEADDASELDAEEDTIKVPSLTLKQLGAWQRALLEYRSLRALRRLLAAFRAAVYSNDEDASVAWTIDDPAVYDKLLITSLRYTPFVLQHHVPYKKLPDGKFKAPTQTAKLKTLSKMILSHFYNVIRLLEHLSEKDTLILAFNESAKLLPYAISSRKAVKLYLKACLNQWSSAADEVRIAAFLAMRALSSSATDSMQDAVLKGSYLTIVRSAKSTSAHTLPSINLMKNSASELFCADHSAAYQHAFVYIRQLAIHLRNSMKVKEKDSYKQVYNWQYVHCVDFWSLVLARACDTEVEASAGGESELMPLIYPLTQVALGALKLNSNSRSYPFHLCLLRSIVHLSRHTRTYIPLIPYLTPIILSSLSPNSAPKASTLKPIDLETHLRAPAQYTRTRVYLEGLLEEALFILSELLATRQVQGSVGFPEITLPLVVILKRALKKAVGSKESDMVKVLLERIQEGVQYVQDKRIGVTFGPRLTDDIRKWEDNIRLDETPVNKYVKTQKKIRDRRKKLLEKAREGEVEMLED